MISGGETDDDDDNVSLDSFDNEPFEDTMRRLGTNDPSLTTLRVGLDGHQPPKEQEERTSDKEEVLGLNQDQSFIHAPEEFFEFPEVAKK
jgi:hypothetical protein